MLIVRLKRCECALADGLLDEAYELLRAGDLRVHRKGQLLAGHLVAALVERGRNHLAAGRLGQALADGDKAVVLGGEMEDVAKLRTAAATAIQEQAQARRAAGQVVAAVRRAVDMGNLTVGERILADAGPAAADLRGYALREELRARRAAVDVAVGKARTALADGGAASAAAFLAHLGRESAGDAGVREVCDRIETRVADEAGRAFDAGRVDEAGRVLATADRLPVRGMNTDAVRVTIDGCRAAWKAIEAGRAGEALEILRRVYGIRPDAAWLKGVIGEVEKVSDALAAVRSGPLSLAGEVRGPRAEVRREEPTPHLVPPPIPGRKDCHLHVDGVGSFLVCMGAQVTLGPVGASRGVDVPLMVDAAVPAVTVARSEEDYFVRCVGGLKVNDEETANRLLRSGDRISVGDRCRVTFRRPSPASGSAVLDLAGTRLPGSPVRQVILMDREIIIGPGAGAHVRADELAAPVVLQPRDAGRWACRSVADVSVDDRNAGTSAEFDPGQRVAVGPVRFVVVGQERRV